MGKKEEPNKIEKKYLDILQDPNLFDKITIEEFDKKIVGVIEARRLIFLCAMGRLVENCQIASFNLLVNDEAGSGKDYICKNILEILPKNQYIYKSRISPTVLTYYHNSNNEPNWTWNGKVFYNEDISESVLNSDVFKVMCSSGSDATIVIDQCAVDIKINGKPVMITTTATAIPIPELVRRFAIVHLTENKKQTEEVMIRHSKFAQEGIVPEYDEDIIKSLNFHQRIKVKIHYADKIPKHFPNNHVIMRTLYPRFLDFIKASLGFHQFQRKQDDEGYYIAKEQDYEIAREGIETIKSNKYLIPLTITQKKILQEFYKKVTIKDNPHKIEDYQLTNLKGSLVQLHNKFNFISLPALQTNLGILAKYGIISTEIDSDNYFHKDTLIYFLNKSFIEASEKKLPKFKEL